MKKYLLILTLLLLCYSLNAQDTNIVKYLPLKVGNVWVYYFMYVSYMQNGVGYDKFSLTNTTQINGKTYYTVQQNHVQIAGNYSCVPALYGGSFPIRIDSLNCNIYKATNCLNLPETLVDSLRSRIGDSAIACTTGVLCTDTNMTNLFGSNRQSKNFTVSWFEGQINVRYTKNIGLSASHYNFMGGSCYTDLRGCVINGLVYGDTSIPVGIKQINSEVPEKFSLSQNYPNPFNPVTKIKFEIPNSKSETNSKTKIRIYDVLGKEIAVPVNEKLSPGTYEVEWDGTNYPSGVYYYKLIVSSEHLTKLFTETKRMVLIK